MGLLTHWLKFQAIVAAAVNVQVGMVLPLVHVLYCCGIRGVLGVCAGCAKTAVGSNAAAINNRIILLIMVEYPIELRCLPRTLLSNYLAR